ncbi:hypothetical protein [Cupriavidus pinatubonensis]|uniref:Uncharacterized protein n=1 Tax=Cupriavidus pinatubonensis TaxID=248026 RepID=A0ABM8WEV6_9BURK|nr:hypothetical protein [Cupriavidus pinatubonensis]CAG9165838.1 hypothetical protein LMG23994_00833 [Cupriavidus pinatubonensis]
MVLPILVLEPSEPDPEYVPIPREREVFPPPTSKRDKLIRYWRQILGRRAIITDSGRYQTRSSSGWTCEAMAGRDSSALLHDSEHLTRLLLRRAWAKVPRRHRIMILRAVRRFDPNKPNIKVAASQVNAVAWLLAAMHWNGCRHPNALWCKPLHPLTGVVRWLSGFDVVEQHEHSREILTKLAERVGCVELQCRQIVVAMKADRKAVALLPELLQ